jgi:hypothetical protein
MADRAHCFQSKYFKNHARYEKSVTTFYIILEIIWNVPSNETIIFCCHCPLKRKQLAQKQYPPLTSGKYVTLAIDCHDTETKLCIGSITFCKVVLSNFVHHSCCIHDVQNLLSICIDFLSDIKHYILSGITQFPYG